MSRLDEIKDQLKTKLGETFDRIKETDLYQKGADKYQSLTPSGQKIAKIAAVALALLLVFSYPLSQLQISKDFVTEYEEKRNLIRDFFRTYRETGTFTQLPPSMTSDAMMGSVRGILSSAQLTPEQVGGVFPSSPEGNTIPQNVVSGVVEVKLNKLNLRQTVDIGTQLSNISSTIKVKDLMIQANAEMNGFFDVTYKLYSLKVPEATVEVPDLPPPPKGSKNNNTNNSSGNSSGELDR